MFQAFRPLEAIALKTKRWTIDRCWNYKKCQAAIKNVKSLKKDSYSWHLSFQGGKLTYYDFACNLLLILCSCIFFDLHLIPCDYPQFFWQNQEAFTDGTINNGAFTDRQSTMTPLMLPLTMALLMIASPMIGRTMMVPPISHCQKGFSTLAISKIRHHCCAHVDEYLKSSPYS